MSRDWRSKKENIDRLVRAIVDHRTSLFLSRNRRLSRRLPILSRLAVANGLQFAMDSFILFKEKSYAHSAALAIFGLEEFGKAAYCYYAHKGWVRMEEFHKYMRNHRRKHEVLKSMEILYLIGKQSDKLNKSGKLVPFEKIIETDIIRSRKRLWESLDKLRSRALYVDYESPATTMSFDKSTTEFIISLAMNWGKTLAEVVNP